MIILLLLFFFPPNVFFVVVITLYVFIIKVSIGTLQESFGGEHNCVPRNWLWKDPHSCVAYVRAAPLDTQTSEEHMCISCAHSGSCSTGVVLFYSLELDKSISISGDFKFR